MAVSYDKKLPRMVFCTFQDGSIALNFGESVVMIKLDIGGDPVTESLELLFTHGCLQGLRGLA